MGTSSKQLQQVRELIKAGKRKAALAQIAALIEKDHDNPELWWLLANATQDSHRAARALDQMESLAPGDSRIDRLRKKIDARRVLDEMGVRGEAGPTAINSRERVLFFVAFAAVAFLIVAGVIVSNLLNRSNANEDISQLPTTAALPTETPTFTPSPSATPTETALPPSETPTETPTLEAEVVNPEVTPDSANPQGVQSVGPEVTPDISAEATQEAAPETPPLAQPTPPETLPPGGTRGTNQVPPENTPDSVPTLPAPEGTIDPNIALTPTLTPPFAPTQLAENKGQIVVDQPRRLLIIPYGEHTYNFSAYRDERVVLELVNVSGEGNPSLQVINALGAVVAEDIDTANPNNLDALIDVRLPDDGIYTVIVRMAAVEEQLYRLTLTRGE
jgi:hypothetical protein